MKFSFLGGQSGGAGGSLRNSKKAEQSPIANRKWKLLAASALIALTAWALYIAARREGFHWKAFVAVLSSLDWRWLLVASLCALGTYYGRALRWSVLIRPVSPHPGMWNLLSATVIGFTAVTLLGRPGEFVRPYLIAVKERVPFSSQLAAWLLERIFDLLIALTVFGFALARVHSSGISVGPALSWVLAFGGKFVGFTATVCLAVFLLIRHFSETMRLRMLDGLRFLPAHQFARAERLVNAFVQGTEATRGHFALLLLVIYTALEWCLIAACYSAISRAYGSALHFGWTDVLIFMGFVAFGSVVQVPGIGGGVQMVAVVVLTELFGARLEIATSFALLLWIIMFVVIAPFGILLALRDGLDWAKLKSMGREMEL